MFTFTSVHRKFAIYGSPKGDGLEYKAEFTPNGVVGIFITNDENLAQKLRQHPDYNKKFTEIGAIKTQNSNVISGIRSSVTQPELGKEQIPPEKYVEFGKLQTKLLKSDGTYRKDASEEDIARYEALKTELNQ